MRRTVLHAIIGLSVLGSTLALGAHDAQACGACFAPPENPTIVTDHRMILTIAQDQSTLYDQIRYTGSPASFAWVLPYSGTITYDVSADKVFEVFDQVSETQIFAPPRNCPPPPTCQNDSSFAGAPSAGAASDAGANGVDVISRKVVGPYDTVQLHSTDANALETWLAQNNFAIPADMKPVIAQYVAEHFDFLALKLIPTAGIQDMRPMRVTTSGANAVLPLRMVAGGTGATVGITLWVLGDGRYQPQNFPSFQITADDLAWDWNQNKSNYTDLRATRAAQNPGTAWEVESSMTQYADSIKQQIIGYYGGTGTYAEQYAQQDYDPVVDKQTNAVLKTAVQVRDEDMATLFHSFAGSFRLTRMRGDIAHTALTSDLVMTAPTDQSTLANVRQVTKELNEPQCPVYDGCSQVGTAPRSEAQAQNSANGSGKNETFSCNTGGANGTHAWLGVGFGYLALAVGRAFRRRKSA